MSGTDSRGGPAYDQRDMVNEEVCSVPLGDSLLAALDSRATGRRGRCRAAARRRSRLLWCEVRKSFTADSFVSEKCGEKVWSLSHKRQCESSVGCRFAPGPQRIMAARAGGPAHRNAQAP